MGGKWAFVRLHCSRRCPLPPGREKLPTWHHVLPKMAARPLLDTTGVFGDLLTAFVGSNPSSKLKGLVLTGSIFHSSLPGGWSVSASTNPKQNWSERVRRRSMRTRRGSPLHPKATSFGSRQMAASDGLPRMLVPALSIRFSSQPLLCASYMPMDAWTVSTHPRANRSGRPPSHRGRPFRLMCLLLTCAE